MTQRKPVDASKQNTSDDDIHWQGSSRAAHRRDESAQTRDIERLSDKGPDDADEHLTDAERDARDMRTKNEAP